MFQPSYVITGLDLNRISDSLDVFLIARPDGQVVLGSQGPIFHDIPADIESYSLSRIFLGNAGGKSWHGIRISQHACLPFPYKLLSLREFPVSMGDVILGMASRAVQLVRFDALTQFCGYCGSKNVMKNDENAKVCSSCGRLVFPKLSPAVIVRITDGNRILLSRSPHFPNGMYSVQAGFVEAGESLEAAAHREILEEVGIMITDLSYFGSQPWPFPDSLMVGFTARYAGGEITIDGKEIENAGWFDASHLPALPGPDSIARALIDDWLRDKKS